MRGDVQTTLLELLNPEQANDFADSYLDFAFDFSEVIFICTSNSTANMLKPLLDRIEVINVPAYLPTEKIQIAKKYLVPDYQKEYAFAESQTEKFEITDAALVKMINHYCGYEAGVRNLRKCIDRVFRKVVAGLEEQKTLSAVPAEKPITELKEEDKTAVEENLIEEAAAPNVALPTEEAQEEEKVDEVERDLYQVNSQNLEKFLDVPITDDHYFQGING